MYMTVACVVAKYPTKTSIITITSSITQKENDTQLRQAGLGLGLHDICWRK